jgi:hypothetical protein
MKDQKSERSGFARDERFPPEPHPKPQRSVAMMQTDAQVRKTRGRLSRHVQNKLGETLHAMFDEIVKEGVPDRFSKLLDQINGGNIHARESEHHAEAFVRSDTLVKTRGPDHSFEKPEDKGSS